MRVKGCEIDSLFYKSLGCKDFLEVLDKFKSELEYKKFTDCYTKAKLFYVERKEKFNLHQFTHQLSHFFNWACYGWHYGVGWLLCN